MRKMSTLEFNKNFIEGVPMPMCVVDDKGKIVDFNSHIGEVFLYDDITGSDFFALTGVKLEEVIEESKSKVYKTIERSDKTFKVFTSEESFSEGDEGKVLVFFYDITRYEILKET